MNPNIKAAVSACENLHLKVNIGERHRITKNALTGSLWLEVQQEAYRLKLTGEVLSELRHYIESKVGKPTYEDQGNPVWLLPFDNTMKDIVTKLDIS